MTAEEDKVIRSWARKQGLQVGTRGRLDKKIKERYHRSVESGTVDAEDIAEVTDLLSPRKSDMSKRTMCGWCETHQHERCVHTVRQGSNVVPRVWVCVCFEKNKQHHPDIVA
jgi:hypothetical protein